MKPRRASQVVSDGEARIGAGVVELALTFTALVFLLFVQMLISDGLSEQPWSDPLKLIWHPLWLDECLTHVIVNDSSFGHSMSALRGGVDTNPPLLYLMLRPLKWVVGTIGVVELRVFAGCAMILALLGMYAICRRYFDLAASWVGVLALLAHPAIVEQTLEARGYGVLLAATAWFGYSMLLSESSRRALVAACTFAVVASTVHWLGILAIGLISLVDVIVHRGAWRRLIPLACAGLAALGCAPFLLGQRANLTIPTWLEPLSLTQARLVLNKLFGWGGPLAVLLIFWLWRVCGDREIGAIEVKQHGLSALAPFSTLLLFPVVLVLFSLAIQPAMMTRYALVSTLPLALLCGWLGSQMNTAIGRAVRTFLLIALVLVGVAEQRARTQLTDITDVRINSALYNVSKLVEANGPLPVVFERRHELYPAVTIRPELAPSMALLCGRSLTVGFSYEQQMGRLVRRFYPQFNVVEFSQLQQMKHFYIVVPMEAGADLNSLFPDARMRQHAPDLYEVLLRDPPTSATAPRE